MKWWDWVPWSSLFECWVLNQLFTLLFDFHQGALQFIFAFCSKDGIIWYLRLLIFLPAVLIPACASLRLAYCMKYCAFKLNEQGDNIQPWCPLFPIWNQSVFPSLALIVASWHAWDLLKEVSIIFITSTIVWSQVNRREGTQLHPSTENWIKVLQRMAPPIRTEPSFPVTLSSGSFHKPLILLHQRADRLKTTITEN